MLVNAKLFLIHLSWYSTLRALGAWGIFLISGIDSAAVPMPLDALVAGYVFSNHHRAWLYCLAGALGSALGSLVPYGLGRAGGELFLLKRISEERLLRIRDRFERQEFLALMVPAMLPPPTPFKLFVFAAGVFEMKIWQAMVAIVCGRLVRFGVLAGLTIAFGPRIVEATRALIRVHPLIAVGIGIAALGVLALVFWLLRRPAEEISEELKHPGRAKH